MIANKNYFEEVIDKMMIDSFPVEFKEKISSMSTYDKRMSILSLLDKDRNLFLSIKSLIKGNKVSKVEHLKDVILMLREYVKVGEVEKKKFGEVMTPLDLVKEMIATLPEEVWSNPDLKWLDPANGTGPFPIMVIYKLMKGLESWESDEEKRYKHIVENMIYVCELQPKNMFLYMCAVDPNDEYELNVYTGSFLEEGFDKHIKEVWGLEKFDVVLGNPPYNLGTSGGNGSRDLWDKFVHKGLESMKDAGKMIFVHPPKWRSPGNSIFEKFKNRNLKYLEIHSKQDGQKNFGAITRYDFYLLINSKYDGSTKIKDEKGNEILIDLSEWDWLPNYNYDDVKRIISTSNRCSIIYSRSMYGNDKKHMSRQKSERNTLPCIYGMYKDGTFSLGFSSERRGHFGIKKVILGIGEILYPLIDMNGEYGMMNNAFAIEISNKEEGLNIKRAIESPRFKEIIKSTKWGNFQTNYKMFENFKKDFWKEFVENE